MNGLKKLKQSTMKRLELIVSSTSKARALRFFGFSSDTHEALNTGVYTRDNVKRGARVYVVREKRN